MYTFFEKVIDKENRQQYILYIKYSKGAADLDNSRNAAPFRIYGGQPWRCAAAAKKQMVRLA